MKHPHSAIAGMIAITVALYHAIKGEQLMAALPLDATQHAFVQGTFHIGTAGWLVGGVILIASRTFEPSARKWVAGALALLYGGPAIGTLSLFGPSFAGLGLAAVVAFALFGAFGGRSSQAQKAAPCR